MANYESARRPMGERLLWWGEVGGIVAAVLGVLSRAGGLVLGGAGVAAGSIAIEQMVVKRKSRGQ